MSRRAEASAQDRPSDGVQGRLNDCGAKEGRGVWATASGAQGVQRVWLGLGRVGRVDGSHLSNRPSRAACPEVEPTVGSRFYDLGGESKRQDIASLRRFSTSTGEPEQVRLGLKSPLQCKNSTDMRSYYIHSGLTKIAKMKERTSCSSA